MDPVTATETWLQKHERLVIVLIVLIAGLWATRWTLDYKAKKADQQYATAAQQLADQRQKDAAIEGQVSQLKAGYDAVVAQLSAENAQLAAAQRDRVVVLQQQQAADKTMPLPELGNRWAELAGFGSSDITASTNGLSVTDTAARATVTTLEQVPVLTQNLKDETTVAHNAQTQLTQANGLIAGLNDQVGSLKVTIADDDKACTAKVNDVKAQANKSKVKWFKIGFVSGFLSGVFAGHHI